MRASRNLAAVAAASLVGGALALIAPSAALAAPPPAGADLVGTVLVNGAAAPDTEVDVYGVNADGTNDFLAVAYTDAGGQYFVDFDGDDASDGTVNADNPHQGGVFDNAPTQTQFKLGYFDARTETRGVLDWQTQYSGNQPTLKRAVPLNRVVGGVTAAPAVALATDSGIQGTVTLPPLAGYYYTGDVYVYDTDQQFVGGASFDNNPTNDATDPLNGQVAYEVRNLPPGGTYTVQFVATASPIDQNSIADDLFFIGSFYGNSTTFTGAKDVKTSPSAFTPGIDGTLRNTLNTVDAPSIKGTIAPGKKVKADHGVWNLTAQTTYSYQWLLNGKLVSTDDSYKIPAKAKKTLGKKLQLVVTAQNFNYSGTVSTKATRVKLDSKLKAKILKGGKTVKVSGSVRIPKAKGKKLKQALKGVKVVVSEVVKTDDGTKLVRLGRAKVRNGNVNVALKGLTAGKHKVQVDILGKKIAETVRNFTVKL